MKKFVPCRIIESDASDAMEDPRPTVSQTQSKPTRAARRIMGIYDTSNPAWNAPASELNTFV